MGPRDEPEDDNWMELFSFAGPYFIVMLTAARAVDSAAVLASFGAALLAARWRAVSVSRV